MQLVLWEDPVLDVFFVDTYYTSPPQVHSGRFPCCYSSLLNQAEIKFLFEDCSIF